ncbi:MAG: septum formation inhibitor Maf [Ruminococcaceae bacterium]|nr:septum formation inhibitor Maf [Oscillospiraceae bacterium]
MKEKTHTLVLASASPRRREILTEAGIAHVVRPADFDESVFDGVEPRLMVQLLAAGKAAAAAEAPGEWLLGADTVVSLSGQVLGKPKDEEEAFAMLSRLSGKTHHVYTGVALLCAETGRMKTCCEETAVTFRTLSDEEIRTYIATGEPMDKAGAYGIQGKGGALVEKTEGDFQNVVGLPLCAVRRLFAEMNIE